MSEMSEIELFELFGLSEGTNEVCARGWALVQLVSGFFGTLAGVMVLITGKKELRMLSEPYVTYKPPQYGEIFNRTILHVPSILEVSKPIIPWWDAGLNVIIGGGFMAMGIVLLIAVEQKNARKCTTWLNYTRPMVLAIICRSVYKAYMDPKMDKLFNFGVWAMCGYCINIVYLYRQECVEFERTARIIKEREMD